jgi:Beta-ketoacyl synthase, N-terminal domain
MSRIFVHGLGAVTPAGWGVPALRAALAANKPLPTINLPRPGWEKSFSVRQVPPLPARQGFLAHPRLRRASSIAQHTVAAALEALGDNVASVQAGSQRLGVVVCLMAGCVTYSRRFCEEMFRDPATASPLIFPETVFNAPASHVAAYLGSSGINYTLVGDDSTFLQGLSLAAEWLLSGNADGCVVVGGEELDWIVADAMRLFHRQAIHSAGAGAVYLRGNMTGNALAELAVITDAFPFTARCERLAAAQRMKGQLCPASPTLTADGAKELLCLGTQRLVGADAAELTTWQDWTGPRLAPKETFGEAFAASAAWQCVAACDALQRGEFSAASISVLGVNQQVIGARFVAANHLRNS